MGCIHGYCSSGPNILILKDKTYTATIISNDLTNPMYSYKTNNKFLSVSSSRQDSENMENTVVQKKRASYSNKEIKLPINPFPFVKLKPKKN